MTLKECDSIDLTRISSPNDFIAAASSSETLEQIEEIVTAWIKQIEQVHVLYTEFMPGVISERLQTIVPHLFGALLSQIVTIVK